MDYINPALNGNGSWAGWRAWFGALAFPQAEAPEWLLESVPADLEPSQECDGSSDCTVSSCQAEDGGFVHGFSSRGMDVEGPCPCEHHELRTFAVLS